MSSPRWLQLGADETATISVTVDPGGQGIEAAAREARYAALAQIADHFGARVVLLGHTLDDQAETVLLGLTRGSGGRSLAGMRRSVEDLFFRPLLDVTRAQTEAACAAQGIEFWTDPQNGDPRFTRSRVRHDVMPVLERELGPGVAAALARTADQVRADTAYLDEVAAVALDSAPGARAPCPWRHWRGWPRRSVPGCCDWPRSRPAPSEPSCSTPTCARSSAWSPSGTARSGSTSPDTCAPYGRATCCRFDRRPG